MSEQMKARPILVTLSAGACLLAGCGSTTSRHPAPPGPQVQVISVTGAIGVAGATGPESPKEKQVERELSGVQGAAP